MNRRPPLAAVHNILCQLHLREHSGLGTRTTHTASRRYNSGQLLHDARVAHLTAKDEDGHNALSASTTSSPSETAHVLRRIPRKVEEDDVLHMGCIDAAGGTVCANEHHALVVVWRGEELLSRSTQDRWQAVDAHACLGLAAYKH